MVFGCSFIFALRFSPLTGGIIRKTDQKILCFKLLPLLPLLPLLARLRLPSALQVSSFGFQATCFT